MPYEDITLITPDKLHLKCYLIRPANNAVKNNLTILFLHANAGNLGHRLPIAQIFYKLFHCNIFMVSYRGYGHSEGYPDEKGLKIDGQTALDFIKNHPNLGPTKVLMYGQSIGGALAVHLASRNEDKIDGMVIENTFLSMRQLIPSVMPYIRWLTFLCHQRWESNKDIQLIKNTPILFLSGKKDELIPPWHMWGLFNVCQQNSASRIWHELPEGTHNDTCLQEGYYEAIYDFVKQHVLGL